MEDIELKIIDLIKRLSKHLSNYRKKQLAFLFLLMLVTSFTEMMSIGLALPFLGIITDTENTFKNANLKPIINYLNISNASELILPLCISFGFVAILSGLLRILLLWHQTILSKNIGCDLSIKVYENTLKQPYWKHLERNSSEIITGLNKANDLTNVLIHPLLAIASTSIILTAIIYTLISINITLTIVTFLIFGSIYSFIVVLSKNKIKKSSEIISKNQIIITKTVQEGLGGIRDIIIDGSQKTFIDLYKNAFIPFQFANAKIQVISYSPRFIIEALVLVIISILVITLSNKNENIISVLPIIGVVAIGAQRILPLLQQLYTAIIYMQGNKNVIEDAIKLLEEDNFIEINKLDNKIDFKKSIAFKNIYFSYNKNEIILKNINNVINKGEKIGIIGETGSGKSTFLDIFMGLLSPTNGEIYIDDVKLNKTNLDAWSKNIAHVPQNIFLSDATIAENIAFGKSYDNINFELLEESIIKAHLYEAILEMPDGYNTLVGERGVRLSGGQCQRIGIARAIYKKRNIIVFDEATSSLDNETENYVMKAIDALGNDTTVLIVAHRLTTLKNCDRIIKVENGYLVDSIKYEAIEK